jgi:REP element-mobilizing transposase RayT
VRVPVAVRRTAAAVQAQTSLTLRLKDPRGRRTYRVVEQALYRGANRFRARLLRFSVMGNHIHMLLEARDRDALMASSKGLAVRLAKRINGLMGSRGRVFEDRYFCRWLREDVG